MVLSVFALGLTGCATLSKFTPISLAELEKAGDEYYIVEAYLVCVSAYGNVYSLVETPAGQTSEIYLYDSTSNFPEQFDKRVEPDKKYTLYLRKGSDYYLKKIEGLMSLEELPVKEAREKERRVTVRVNYAAWGMGIFTLVDWQKAFPDKAAAEAWLTDIAKRAKDILYVLDARIETLQNDVNALKAIPGRITRDNLTNSVRNVTEAYNRFKPLNAEIAVIAGKGAVIEAGYWIGGIGDRGRYEGGNGLGFFVPDEEFYPGLTDEAVAEKIDNTNKELARLLDMYPAN
jgi:hypothetical protein